MFYAGRGIVAVAVLGLCGFVAMKIYPLVHGPAINLGTLSDGASVADPMIRIAGKALYTKDLAVNGNPLPLSPDGSFDDKLVLNPGYNVISLQARDRFGKVSNHDYEIVLKESPTGLSFNTSSPAQLRQIR